MKSEYIPTITIELSEYEELKRTNKMQSDMIAEKEKENQAMRDGMFPIVRYKPVQFKGYFGDVVINDTTEYYLPREIYSRLLELGISEIKGVDFDADYKNLKKQFRQYFHVFGFVIPRII